MAPLVPALRRYLPAVVLLIAALVVAASANAGNGGLGPVSPASPNAGSISTTWWIISGIVVALFLVVEAALVTVIIRHRRGGGPSSPESTAPRAPARLQAMIAAVPAIAVAAVFVVVVVKLPGITDIPRAGASGPLEVRVSAQQFYWQYTYPNGVVSIDRLRAPVGVPVRLTITAPKRDVVHSWWVPALGGKVEAIPGHTTTAWFRADRTGLFEGRCAALCGIYHTKMTTAVEAMPKGEFDIWYGATEQAQASADPELGRQTWEQVCAKCHGLSGEGDYGPALAAAVLQNAERITQIVREGGRIRMPAVGSEWTQLQIDSLNAYLKELQPGGS